MQAWEQTNFSAKWVREVGLDARGMRFARDVRRQLEAATGADGERLHPSASEAQLDGREGSGGRDGGGRVGGGRDGGGRDGGGRDGGGRDGGGRKRLWQEDDGASHLLPAKLQTPGDDDFGFWLATRKAAGVAAPRTHTMCNMGQRPAICADRLLQACPLRQFTIWRSG